MECSGFKSSLGECSGLNCKVEEYSECSGAEQSVVEHKKIQWSVLECN